MKYICKIRNNKLLITPRNRLIAPGSGTSRWALNFNRTCEKLTFISRKISPILILKKNHLFFWISSENGACAGASPSVHGCSNDCKNQGKHTKNGSALVSIGSSVTQTREKLVSGGDSSRVRSIETGLLPRQEANNSRVPWDPRFGWGERARHQKRGRLVGHARVWLMSYGVDVQAYYWFYMTHVL